jgi:hypothetical protein
MQKAKFIRKGDCDCLWNKLVSFAYSFAFDSITLTKPMTV